MPDADRHLLTIFTAALDHAAGADRAVTSAVLMGASVGGKACCRRCRAARKGLKGPPPRGSLAAARSLAVNASRPSLL